MNWLVDKLIAYAKRTPYTHLWHGDGTPYMERYWLVPYSYAGKLGFLRHPFGWLLQKLDIAVRIHWIATEDKDRHLHDHPWAFLSVVLKGSYLERRPVKISPCFVAEQELTFAKQRRAGSVAFRWWTDRHAIAVVSPGGVWTLFISFPVKQWWGFYTKQGKVYYRDYESVHNSHIMGD